jgi:glucose/arabinose dehydrogenase
LEDRLTPTTLLPGFSEATVASGISGPTAMDFSPDGRLWVLEQAGNVKLVHNDGTTFTALHLNVDSAGERGLLGIAFDPNFASNHFVYLYYTNPSAGTAYWATGVHNQISRFTVNDANPLQPTFTSEAAILDLNSLSSATNHNGGSIHFGLDGMLYADTGDNVQTFTGPDNNSYRVSQTLANMLGKQLRIDVSKFNSGAATRDDTTVGDLIPTSNPFVGKATGINQLIYVLGLRNPFTFAVQPGTGRILINDVGETTWEEIDDAIAGSNYGWSGGNSDGFGHPPPAFASGTYQDPLLAYTHSGSASQASGAAIVGGTFYNPTTVQFPSSYVGMYFYEDLASGWIRYFNPNNPNAPATPDGNSNVFATNTPGALRDLKVDAVGNLYYLSGGDGAIHKISYQAPKITGQPTNQTISQGQTASLNVTATGPSLNYQWQHLVGSTWTNVGTSSGTLTIANTTSADAGSYRVIVSNTFGSTTSSTATLTINVAGTSPTITTQPSNQQVNVGQSVTFTVAASGTAPLTYQWQHQVGSTWTNVGVNSATFTIATAASTDASSYRAVVTNSVGSATSNTATLSVNRLPTPTITTPASGTMYNWSQTISFAGSATDPEDGTLADANLSWEIRFYHETAADGTGLHFHPFQTFSGVASGSIVVNFPETSPLIWYRFILIATDSKGASASTSVDIHPNLGQFTLQSNPAGLQLMLDGGPVAAGATITGTVGQPRTIAVASPQTLNGTTYTFVSWSDGGSASHSINTPSATTTFTATFGTAPTLAAVADQAAPSSQQTVNVSLSATGSPAPTFTATGQSLAYVLTQQTGTLTYVSRWDNYGSRSEKWLQAASGQWYFILPTGELDRWNAAAGANGASLGNVGVSYYVDATRLQNPPANQPHATFAFSGTTLTITRDLAWISSIVVTVTASNTLGSDSKTFNVTITNNGTAPTLAAITDQTAPSSQQTVNVSLSATGSPAPNFIATGQSLAYVLTQQTGTLTYVSRWDNYGSRSEKWL